MRTWFGKTMKSAKGRRYFPVNCFLIFSTNSLSIASAFLRMIGWPNSPILPKNIHIRLDQEFGLIGAELFEHHAGFAAHGSGSHAIFRLGTQSGAPVLVILFFDNYFSLKIEGNRPHSDFQMRLRRWCRRSCSLTQPLEAIALPWVRP